MADFQATDGESGAYRNNPDMRRERLFAFTLATERGNSNFALIRDSTLGGFSKT